MYLEQSSASRPSCRWRHPRSWSCWCSMTMSISAGDLRRSWRPACRCQSRSTERSRTRTLSCLGMRLGWRTSSGAPGPGPGPRTEWTASAGGRSPWAGCPPAGPQPSRTRPRPRFCRCSGSRPRRGWWRRRGRPCWCCGRPSRCRGWTWRSCRARPPLESPQSCLVWWAGRASWPHGDQAGGTLAPWSPPASGWSSRPTPGLASSHCCPRAQMSRWSCSRWSSRWPGRSCCRCSRPWQTPACSARPPACPASRTWRRSRSAHCRSWCWTPWRTHAPRPHCTRCWPSGPPGHCRPLREWSEGRLFWVRDWVYLGVLTQFFASLCHWEDSLSFTYSTDKCHSVLVCCSPHWFDEYEWPTYFINISEMYSNMYNGDVMSMTICIRNKNTFNVMALSG